MRKELRLLMWIIYKEHILISEMKCILKWEEKFPDNSLHFIVLRII